MYSFQTGSSKRKSQKTIRILSIVIFVLAVALIGLTVSYLRASSASRTTSDALMARATNEANEAQTAVYRLTQSSGTNTMTLLSNVRAHIYAMQCLNTLASNIYGAGTVIVLEATTAGDIPGAPKSRVACRVGAGAVVSFMDGGTVYPRELIELAMATAGEKGIRAQLKELVAGGNDASAYQRAAAGARVLALSAPVRYIHSACSVAKIDDLEQVYALANALAERSFDK